LRRTVSSLRERSQTLEVSDLDLPACVESAGLPELGEDAGERFRTHAEDPGEDAMRHGFRFAGAGRLQHESRDALQGGPFDGETISGSLRGLTQGKEQCGAED
jgi:hypothetical protein